jgi:hypothetical protein
MAATVLPRTGRPLTMGLALLFAVVVGCHRSVECFSLARFAPRVRGVGRHQLNAPSRFERRLPGPPRATQSSRVPHVSAFGLAGGRSG